MVNTTLKVEKVKGERKENTKNEVSSAGPTSIVFKKYGGNIYAQQAKKVGFRVNEPMVQSLIFHELSERGWGPKLYGLFEGGRVEEMIDCHTLTGEEAFTSEFIRDVAKAYARFHSLQLPIDHNICDIFVQMLPTVDEGKEQLAEIIESKNISETDPLACFQRLHDFPFHEEGEWLKSIRSKVKQRTVLCNMDPNYLNKLVRNHKPSDPDATRTVIIDLDGTAYSHRGYDLGGHCVVKMFYQTSENGKFSTSLYPSDSERLAFLSAYLEEAEKLFDDFDGCSLDSLENLILECDIGALAFLLGPYLAGFMRVPSILERKPQLANFIDPMLQLYQELKKQFCAKYSDLIRK